MNETILRYGRLVGRAAANHPKAAARMLAAAYRLVGFQSGHFPKKNLLPAREQMAAVIARQMADALVKPDTSAVVNIFMPCELFQNLGIPTVFPEAVACYVVNTAAERVFIESAEANGSSESLCSYHKVLQGMSLMKVMPRPLIVANTTLACDANQLTFREVAELSGREHVVIDVPYRADEEAVSYVAGQLREMGKVLEDTVHRSIDEEELKRSVVRGGQTMKNFLRYLPIRADRHLPEIFTAEMIHMFAHHALMGTQEALDYSRQLLEDVQRAPMLGEVPRILWVHVLPNWQDSMKEIFNDSLKCEVVACEMSVDSFCRPDPEHPYESMARRIVYDSLNGPSDRRIGRLTELAKTMKADGTIIFTQWGCKQTQGMSMMAKARFEEMGLPALILDGDGCDMANVSDGQMVTRVRAFLEQLGVDEK